MSQVEADIEALKAFREALLTFINRQKEALEAAEREINTTLTMMDEAERYWYYQVEERQRYLEQCEMEAASAAAERYYIDCSSYAYALQEAKEQLAHIRQWQCRVDKEIHVYQQKKQNIAYLLESDEWQALNFLDNRIKALEAYYETRVSSFSSVVSEVASIVGTGITVVMGGVINAVRNSQHELHQVMGSIGEEVTAQVCSQKFGLKAFPSPSLRYDFERVFSTPGMPLIVMESKANDSIPQQDRGKRVAQVVQEVGAEDTPTVAVVTDPVHGLADIYTRKEGSDWQLLSSGKDIDQVPPQPSKSQVMPLEMKEGEQSSHGQEE